MIRVLLIEANLICSYAIKLLLEREGCVVDVAHDSKTGYKSSFQRKYDFIVTDVYIDTPEDGFDLVRNIYHDCSKNETLPIYCFTDEYPWHYKKALQIGIRNCFKSPLTYKDIHNIVSDVKTGLI